MRTIPLLLFIVVGAIYFVELCNGTESSEESSEGSGNENAEIPDEFKCNLHTDEKRLLGSVRYEHNSTNNNSSKLNHLKYFHFYKLKRLTIITS